MDDHDVDAERPQLGGDRGAKRRQKRLGGRVDGRHRVGQERGRRRRERDQAAVAAVQHQVGKVVRDLERARRVRLVVAQAPARVGRSEGRQGQRLRPRARAKPEHGPLERLLDKEAGRDVARVVEHQAHAQALGRGQDGRHVVALRQIDAWATNPGGGPCIQGPRDTRRRWPGLRAWQRACPGARAVD